MSELCTPRAVETLADLETLADSLVIDWIANLGEEVVPRQYEFSTSDTDLLAKMKVLSLSSKKFADPTVFWEIYYCESCALEHGTHPLHARISEVA